MDAFLGKGGSKDKAKIVRRSMETQSTEVFCLGAEQYFRRSPGPNRGIESKCFSNSSATVEIFLIEPVFLRERLIDC